MIFARNIFFAFIPIIFCGVVTFAQTDISSQPSAQSVKAKPERKHTINFEDELVEGTAQKPEFLYLFQKKNFNYKRLVRLRENFIPEMKRSAEDIQRLKGGR